MGQCHRPLTWADEACLPRVLILKFGQEVRATILNNVTVVTAGSNTVLLVIEWEGVRTHPVLVGLLQRAKG